MMRVIDKTQNACTCFSNKDLVDFITGKIYLGGSDKDLQALKTIPGRRSEVVEPQQEENNFTYVPPAKTDITPNLLAQSLTTQPQNTATVGQVMIWPSDDVIMYGAQFDGFVASTIPLNASTEIPCNGIGTPGQKLELEIRPKDVNNGTAHSYVPDCWIVAVNMYNPNVISYWVQNKQGLYSISGGNKIINIDKLNAHTSTSLILRAKQPAAQKRDSEIVERNMADQEIANRALKKKTLVPPDSHNAAMTPEACAAIKCNNNDGQPAMYNPFTKMCGCKEPAYVEADHSG